MNTPFAYNPSLTPIAGTTQVGELAVGYPTAGFESTGLQWWMGPSEDSGYVIAKSKPLNNQPTPVTEDALYLNPAAKGAAIVLSNGNQTATQATSDVQSVLGDVTPIIANQSTMFTVRYNSTGSTSLDSRVIGVGQSTMNYAGPGGYPGNDPRGVGFSADGQYFFSGSVLGSDLVNWVDGDIIDIAFTPGVAPGKIWIRVNGGDWNNDPGQNPTNPGTGFSLQGLVNLFPVLCPGGSQSTMTVLKYPPFGVPDGYNFFGNVTASVGFNRSTVLSEASFIAIAETLTGETFATGNDAKTYLNTNGYWTSYP